MAQREELTLNREKATFFVVRRQKVTGEWGGRGEGVFAVVVEEGGREKLVSDGSMKTDTFFTAASSPRRAFDTEKMLSKYLPSK